MRLRIGRTALAALLASVALTGARADDACPRDGPLSPALFEKLLAYVKSNVGTAAIFYAPLPFDFGWTDDARLDVSTREVASDDRTLSFAQSRQRPGDDLVTAFDADGAWFFVTGPDLCLVRALHRPYGAPPQPLDVHAPAVQARYAAALRAWAHDLGHSPPAPAD